MSRPSVNVAILDAVARIEGVAPTDLGQQFAEAVDPDALEALFADGDRSRAAFLEIQFPFAGHRVVVSSDGSVEIDGERAVI